MEEKKKIEVVTGDSSKLDISPVYEHLKDSKPQTSDKKPKNIVIPEESNKDKVSKKDEE